MPNRCASLVGGLGSLELEQSNLWLCLHPQREVVASSEPSPPTSRILSKVCTLCPVPSFSKGVGRTIFQLQTLPIHEVVEEELATLDVPSWLQHMKHHLTTRRTRW